MIRTDSTSAPPPSLGQRIKAEYFGPCSLGVSLTESITQLDFDVTTFAAENVIDVWPDCSGCPDRLQASAFGAHVPQRGCGIDLCRTTSAMAACEQDRQINVSAILLLIRKLLMRRRPVFADATIRFERQITSYFAAGHALDYGAGRLRQT
jgi:hypothetical protein